MSHTWYAGLVNNPSGRFRGRAPGTPPNQRCSGPHPGRNIAESAVFRCPFPARRPEHCWISGVPVPPSVLCLSSPVPPLSPLAPEAMALAAEAVALAPEAMALAPEAMALAPEARAMAPEAMAMAPAAMVSRGPYWTKRDASGAEPRRWGRIPRHPREA